MLIDKYKFHMSEIEFLDYMISDMGINIAQNTIQIILESECPKSQKKVQDFMRFVNFYQSFEKKNSKLTKPLMDTTSQ
jgi:hypothetical protein